MRTKDTLDAKERTQFEFDVTKEFLGHKDDTKHDLQMRVSGVPARNGASGYQLVGYTQLERFYRGDQWMADEPKGASQRTDNYCGVIVDNISSLIFDDKPEVNCPTDDPSDELLEIKAEIKESLINKVWLKNDYEVEFDEWAKSASLYGDGFLKGPWAEKNDEGKWEFKFAHIENPGSVRLIYADAGFKKLLGFIEENRISITKANQLYRKQLKARNITLTKEIKTANEGRVDPDTNIPLVTVAEYWTKEFQAIFVQDKLIDYNFHNYGFIPLRYIKNIYIPNHPYGKSDLEDVIDPQLMHNRSNNDLANLLRWISTVNFWGKNLEGMQALVAGLSKIYSLPDDGELHTFEKPGDPYITNTFSQQRRSAIIELSGVSEAMMSSSQLSVSSGRALALAFQGTIRKLNPRFKRYSVELRHLNENILKLYEIYFPETKKIIDGDYTNEVFISATILRNIIDTLNKLQSGIISLDTAQREAGIKQPKLEQKVMKKNLMDPVLGGQIARQPALLPRLSEGNNQPGDSPAPAPGNAPVAGQSGAVAANNQQSSGAAPTPIVE